MNDLLAAAAPADLIDNRVARSGLITIDLEDYLDHTPRADLDLAPWLWQGLALREKDFRQDVAIHDWAKYTGTAVAVHCSADALIPAWAYMIVATRLAGVAATVVAGTPQELERVLARRALARLDAAALSGARVVVKGCSDKPVPEAAYLEIALLLAPHVASLMYGEACSAVPVYKKGKA